MSDAAKILRESSLLRGSLSMLTGTADAARYRTKHADRNRVVD